VAGTLTLHKFTISGEQLASISTDKQVLLVQLFHIYNAIQVLLLYLVFTGKLAREDARLKASVTQNTLMAKFLVSVHCEAWGVLEKSFFATKLSKEYEAQLSPDGSARLDEIKRYFSKKNIVTEIRNRFGFHFDRNDIVSELQQVKPAETFDIFLSETRGNSLFYLSEEVAGMALLSAIGDLTKAATALDAQNALFRDLIDLSKSFQYFIEELTSLIVLEIKPLPTPDSFEMGNVPELEDVSIPFFVMPRREKPDRGAESGS